NEIDRTLLQNKIDAVGRPERKILQTFDLAGPTGESNRLSYYPRGLILCLGPTFEDAQKQAKIAQSMGCTTLIIAPNATGENAIDGFVDRSVLQTINGFDAVALWSEVDDLKAARMALAAKDGAILPLFSVKNMKDLCILERHICIDTTAAGGNASLLAEQG
ncbi:MAG: bifunctional proline dehydrogenase/L-glutamate gamma-semialdehyde dehydrogenase, partial [Rhizobiales bacterium]|nr:bifunctional proline dehydrogenase/L-glutamate gamma-semialdehyde dehydrogenase [Hyphomicrobiales bacterium]